MILSLSHKPHFPTWVKVLIVGTILACVAFLCSCRAKKEIIKETVTRVDSFIKEVMPFDTSVWIKNHEGKEQEFNNCDSIYALLSRHSGTLTTKENGVKSTITNVGKRLVFKCATDSLLSELTLLKTRLKEFHFKEVVKEVKIPCDKEHKTWLDGLYKRGFWICFLILVLVGVIKYGKFKIPFLK